MANLPDVYTSDSKNNDTNARLLDVSPSGFLSAVPEQESVTFQECCYAMRYLEGSRLANSRGAVDQLLTPQDKVNSLVIGAIQKLVAHSMTRVDPAGRFYESEVIPYFIKGLKDAGIDSENGGSFYSIIRTKKLKNLAVAVHGEGDKIIESLDFNNKNPLLEAVWHPLFTQMSEQSGRGWTIENSLENLNIEGVSGDMIKKLLMLSGKYSEREALSLIQKHYYAGM